MTAVTQKDYVGALRSRIEERVKAGKGYPAKLELFGPAFDGLCVQERLVSIAGMRGHYVEWCGIVIWRYEV